MVDPEHWLYFSENGHDACFDFGAFFSRTLYHMEMIDIRRRFRNVVAGICAASAMSCHTTRNVNLVENTDATSRPSRVEVMTRSGSTIVVFDPIVRQDSLRGFSDEERRNPVTLATSDIQNAKTRQLSGGRTALLVFGLIAAIVAGLLIAAIIAFSETNY